jgi:hypothetical protein
MVFRMDLMKIQVSEKGVKRKEIYIQENIYYSEEVISQVSQLKSFFFPPCLVKF